MTTLICAKLASDEHGAVEYFELAVVQREIVVPIPVDVAKVSGLRAFLVVPSLCSTM